MLRLCCEREAKVEKTAPWRFYTMFWGIYLVGFFMSETTFLFMPMPVFIFAMIAKREGHLGACIQSTVLVVCASIAIAFLGGASQDTVKALDKYFVETYEGYKPTMYPIQALTLTFSHTLKAIATRRLFGPKMIPATLLGLLLTLAPTALLMHRYRFRALLIRLLPGRYSKLMLLIAMLPPLALFFIAKDYGRWVYLIGISYMLMLTAVLDIARIRIYLPADDGVKKRFGLFYMIVLVTFVSTWTMSYIYARGDRAFALTDFGKILVGLFTPLFAG